MSNRPNWREKAEARRQKAEERMENLCTMCIHGTTETCQVCGRCRHLCLDDRSHLYCGPREFPVTVERERKRMER